MNLIEILKDHLKEGWANAESAIRLKLEAQKLRWAIRKAGYRQQATGHRQHVMPITKGFTKQGKEITGLVVIDNREFKWFKRNGMLPRKMSYLELEATALYSTPQTAQQKAVDLEKREEAMVRYMRFARLTMHD